MPLTPEENRTIEARCRELQASIRNDGVYLGDGSVNPACLELAEALVDLGVELPEFIIGPEGKSEQQRDSDSTAPLLLLSE